MEFFGALIVCAMLCVLVQLVCELWPSMEGPTLFLVLISLGAILVPTGVPALMTALGNSGQVITIFNVGVGVCGGMLSILGAGSPASLLIVLGVFCAVGALGVLAGAGYTKRQAKHSGDDKGAADGK
ncbi:MAG: hypothetical protein ACI362_04375 [Coriobacteriales bacterium]